MDRLTILVVDDEPLLQRLITTILEGEGVEVRTASNGEEAGEILNSWRPDLIISEIDMECVGGIQLLDAVREDLGKIPFVVMSADDAVVAEALDHGANAFMAKPFLPEALLDTVQRVVERI